MMMRIPPIHLFLYSSYGWSAVIFFPFLTLSAAAQSVDGSGGDDGAAGGPAAAGQDDGKHKEKGPKDIEIIKNVSLGLACIVTIFAFCVRCWKDRKASWSAMMDV